MTSPQNKNLIVSGGTYEDRKVVIATASKAIQTGREKNVYVLGENISSSEKYLKSITREFPVEKNLSLDCLEDLQLDWMPAKTPLLVVIPELDKLLKNDSRYFYQLLGTYLGHQLIQAPQMRLLVTLAKPFTLDHSRIPVLVGGVQPSPKNFESVILPQA
jgi:hypothetical protein